MAGKRGGARKAVRENDGRTLRAGKPRPGIGGKPRLGDEVLVKINVAVSPAIKKRLIELGGSASAGGRMAIEAGLKALEGES